MLPVRLEPTTPRSRVKHNTTEPHSLQLMSCDALHTASWLSTTEPERCEIDL